MCDLTLTSFAVTNYSPTSSGSIAVTATSSYQPVQYSLDNVSWFNNTVFLSLVNPGTGTLYIRDAAGCTVEQPYTISVITPGPPPTLVSMPVSGTSRWSALFNPVVFGYQSQSQTPGRKFITEITATYNGNPVVMTATHSAGLTGYCRADISKYLRVLMQPKDYFDYSVLNYPDSNIGASYTIRFMETWATGQSGWVAVADPFYVTYSAMQVGNPNGGNMVRYVPVPGAGQVTPARFLNDFINPVFYTDMPFDLTFIYSELLAGLQLKLQGNGIDVNGNICGKYGEVLLLNQNGSALENEDGSFIVLDTTPPGNLTQAVGVNRLCINKNTSNIPANSYYLDVWLSYTDTTGADVPVTEARRLLLDSPPCNGLPYEYLKWMGPTGGWLYYMLTTNQTVEVNATDAVLMENYIADYAAADSTQQLISVSAQKKITAGKNDIPAAEAEVLATLLYSPKVYRLVDAASNTWQGVIIDTKSLTLYQTYGQTGDFEISYLLPEVNVQCA